MRCSSSASSAVWASAAPRYWGPCISPKFLPPNGAGAWWASSSSTWFRGFCWPICPTTCWDGFRWAAPNGAGSWAWPPSPPCCSWDSVGLFVQLPAGTVFAGRRRMALEAGRGRLPRPAVPGILLAYLSNYLLGRFSLVGAEWRWKLGVAAFPALLFLGFCWPICPTTCWDGFRWSAPNGAGSWAWPPSPPCCSWDSVGLFVQLPAGTVFAGRRRMALEAGRGRLPRPAVPGILLAYLSNYLLGRFS